MKRPTFPANRVVREGQIESDSASMRYSGSELDLAVAVALLFGLVVGFAAGWYLAADFIGG